MQLNIITCLQSEGIGPNCFLQKYEPICCDIDIAAVLHLISYVRIDSLKKIKGETVNLLLNVFFMFMSDYNFKLKTYTCEIFIPCSDSEGSVGRPVS